MIPVSIIAAIDARCAIGNKNELLFHVKEDMKHFKEITTGGVVIMGRKTFQSIGRPLPNRINIVITRDTTSIFPDGIQVIHSIEDALAAAEAVLPNLSKQEVFVIGGSDIYHQMAKYANKAYITAFGKLADEADAFLDIDAFWEKNPKCVSDVEGSGVTKDGTPISFRFQEYELKR